MNKPVGMRQKLVDISQLKTIGWNYKIELIEGIQQTYEFYRRLRIVQYKLASTTWDHSEIEAIHSVIESNMYSMGEKVAKYEDNFSRYFGSKYAVMTSSGSTANLLMIAAMFLLKTSQKIEAR